MFGNVINVLQRGGKQLPDTKPALRRWSTKRQFLFLGKDDGLLYIHYKTNKHQVDQLVVPDALIPFVLRLKHDHAGHMAAEKTTSLIRREYFWLNMVADVQKYCQSCVPCARNRPAPSRPYTQFTLSSQPREPWQEIAMDIKGPFGKKPTQRGNRYVLVVIDLLTRAAEMIPIPDKSAKTVARAVVHHVFCRRGIPESILTDRGCEFDNQALSTIAHELGIDKKRISALHPQANGNVERLNRTIGEMLRKSTDECGDIWDLEIPFVQFNYMNHDHSATGYSPFYLSYGYAPRTPRLVLAPGPTKSPSTVQQWASTLASRLKEAHSSAADRDLQNKQRRVAGSEGTSSPLHVGDSVMMHVPPRPGLPSKLQSRWQGPFIVVKCLAGNTYRIKQASNFRKRFLRHRDQLRTLRTRPVRLRPSQNDCDSQSASPVPVTVPPVPRPLENASVPEVSCSDGQPARTLVLPSSDIFSPMPASSIEIPSIQAKSCAGRTDRSDRESLDDSEPEPGPAPFSSLRRGIRSRRPPDRYGEWELNPAFEDDDEDAGIYFLQ